MSASSGLRRRAEEAAAQQLVGPPTVPAPHVVVTLPHAVRAVAGCWHDTLDPEATDARVPRAEVGTPARAALKGCPAARQPIEHVQLPRARREVAPELGDELLGCLGQQVAAAFQMRVSAAWTPRLLSWSRHARYDGCSAAPEAVGANSGGRRGRGAGGTTSSYPAIALEARQGICPTGAGVSRSRSSSSRRFDLISLASGRPWRSPRAVRRRGASGGPAIADASGGDREIRRTSYE